MKPHSLGLVLGGIAGLAHLIWSLLVALGLAEAYLDWVLGLHFLENPFSVKVFDVANAVVLVVFASLMGYVVGYVAGTLWNWAKKK